jgi:phage gp16-like protein
MVTKKQLQIVHVAKGKVGMSDDEYRDMLELRYNVSSSKNLTVEQLDDLMKHFKALGFRGTREFYPAGRQKRRFYAKIQKQLAVSGLSDAYADGIAKNMFGLDSYRWCTDDQLQKIIAALNYHIKRQNRKKETH